MYILLLNMCVMVMRLQPLVEQMARVVVLPAQMRVLSTFLPALVAKANLPDAVCLTDTAYSPCCLSPSQPLTIGFTVQVLFRLL